jgi:3-oxoacyl-[acyl-carrier protein] reductase
MEINLAGRSAIVTGGSKGIGFGVATRFAQSGADVAIVARGREALDAAARSIGTASAARVIAVVADVASPADISRAYDEIMRSFGKVDQKFFAALRLTRLVWPQMKERRWGRVINVLNIGAKAPRGGSAPTTISRAAGMALTKVLAGEGAPHNILVNALLVGIIEADQHVQRAKRTGVPLDEYMERFAKETPIGRAGKPEEFANLACLLASDAGSYITGTAINVDGGRSPVV